MCEKCVEIDERIERYRRLPLSVNDNVTVERFKEVVAGLEAQKGCASSRAAKIAAALPMRGRANRRSCERASLPISTPVLALRSQCRMLTHRHWSALPR